MRPVAKKLSSAEITAVSHTPTQERAETVFRALKQTTYKQTDRMFAWLIAFEWLAAMAAAALISPQIWPSERPLHLLVMASTLAGLIYLLPLYLALSSPGRAATRHIIAIGQMLTPALFIHLTGGGFETDFFIFGAHGLAGLVSGHSRPVFGDGGGGGGPFPLAQWVPSVFGGAAPAPWYWVGFTGWVLFEDTLLALWIWESLRLTETPGPPPGRTADPARDHRTRSGRAFGRASPGERQIQANPVLAPEKRGQIPFPRRIFARRHLHGRYRRPMDLQQHAMVANCGLSSDESLGERMDRRHPSGRQDPVLENWEPVPVRSHRFFGRNFGCRTPDGDMRWVSCQHRPHSI